MPRAVSPAFLAQIASGQLRPALFLEIDFQAESVWVWSGLGAITSKGPAYSPSTTFPYGQKFIGMGWMGQIQSIPAVSDVVAENITILLSGIPVELLTDAINAVRQNSIATVWVGLLDANGSIVGDPVQVFQGSLDVPTITEGASTASISITAENPLIDLNRAPSRRFTDVDQQLDYPGDTGFFQVQLLQDYLTVWPSPVASDSSSAAPPPNFLTITPGQTAPVIIAVAGTQQLTCRNTRSDGSSDIIMGTGNSHGDDWGGPVYSSDPGIATVNANGLVTGIKQGMCIITKRFVQSMYLGGGNNKPSNCVTASVTILVTN